MANPNGSLKFVPLWMIFKAVLRGGGGAQRERGQIAEEGDEAEVLAELLN